jgi:hypothetical protein
MAPGANIKKTYIPLLPLLWVIFIHQKKGGKSGWKGRLFAGAEERNPNTSQTTRYIVILLCHRPLGADIFPPAYFLCIYIHIYMYL